MSSSIKHYRGRGRLGFTLVELLIGITIIGLLVGLLAVAGGGVIGASREFAVNSEITQMSQAIESFKTKYGFYPPSFEQFKRTVNTGDTTDLAIIAAEANQMLPYLNKISPNHQELSASPTNAGRTRLMDWWEEVGCNLDQSSSMQFWLSGLCQNKQFPLTGGLSTSPIYMPVGYNVGVRVDGINIPGGLEREVFYDFDTDRFIPIDIDDDGTATRPVVQYNMEYGKTNGDLFYVYRDSSSYQPVGQPDPSHLDANSRMATAAAAIPASDFASIGAYLASPNHRGPAYYFVNPDGTPEFANANTFQIISFGLDGDPGVSATATPDGERGILFDKSTGVQQIQLPDSDDNLCNFANGRLDKFIIDKQ